MGFCGSKPSPSSLRDATSPERGRFYAANRQMQKAPPSGELSSECETERVLLRPLKIYGIFSYKWFQTKSALDRMVAEKKSLFLKI